MLTGDDFSLDRGPRSFIRVVPSDPLWMSVALFLYGSEHVCNSFEGRRRFQEAQPEGH